MKKKKLFYKVKLFAILSFGTLLGIILCPALIINAACDKPFPIPVLTTDDPINNIINVGLSQEGYREAEDGTAYYSEWLNQSGHSWCSEFVAWCAYMAGIPTDVIPSGTSVNKYRNFFSGKNEFYIIKNGACAGCECRSYTDKTITINEIKPGDIAFIELNDDNTSGDDHTALVVSVSNGYINTIEGNTLGQVKQKKRELSKIHGICKPDYSAVSYSDIVLKKTKLVSIKSTKKDTLKWKVISGVKGYQIYRSTKKNGDYKLIKTINGANKKSYSVGNSSKKKYYYKIATINTYRGVVYHSKYSNILLNK